MSSNANLTTIHPGATFWRDSAGQVVIAEWPNPPILGWLACVLARTLTTGHVSSGFGALGDALLFTWAYLEVTDGADHFRRLLGVAVGASLIIGFFR